MRVQACLDDVVAYVHVMSNHAGLYYDSGDAWVRRDTMPGYERASADIDNLKTAAMECMDIIDGRN